MLGDDIKRIIRGTGSQYEDGKKILVNSFNLFAFNDMNAYVFKNCIAFRMYFGLRPAVNWSDINPGLYKV